MAQSKPHLSLHFIMQFPCVVKSRFQCHFNCCQFQRQLIQIQNNCKPFCTVQLSQYLAYEPSRTWCHVLQEVSPRAFRGKLLVPSSRQTKDPSDQRQHILLYQRYPHTKPHSITTQEHLDFMYAVPHQTIPTQTNACIYEPSQMSPKETTQHQWRLFSSQQFTIWDGLRQQYDANFTLMLMKQITAV